MKLLTDTEFVELARSHDHNRIALCGVLNTGRNLVATDTHVLHVVEYDVPEKPMCDWVFTPGSHSKTKAMKQALEDFEPFDLSRYPQWKRVIPENWEDSDWYESITFSGVDYTFDFLERFRKIAELCGSGTAQNRVHISANKETQVVHFEFKSEFHPTVSFDLTATVSADIEVAVNLMYLLDAMQGVTQEQHGFVELRFTTKRISSYDGSTDYYRLTPYERTVIVTQVAPYRLPSKRYAVVMPCSWK